MAVVLVASGCGADERSERRPSEAQITGAYDVVVADSVRETVGRVEADDRGSIRVQVALDDRSTVTLEGIVAKEGRAELIGTLVGGGDVVSDARGSMRIAVKQGEVTIVGMVSGGGLHLAVSMSRPVTGTPNVVSGRYRVEFDSSLSGCGCPSDAFVTLAVPADGIGQSVHRADDMSADGLLLGAFEPGECVVSAHGNVSCALMYDVAETAPPPSVGQLFAARLTGKLDLNANPVNGNGRVFVFVTQATGWAAVKEAE